MKTFRSVVAFSILLSSLLFLPILPARAQRGSAVLEVLNRQEQVSGQLVDGDQVSLRITLTGGVGEATPVSFRLASSGLEVAGCSIPQGESSCQSEAFSALGWYWDADGTAQPQREVQAIANDEVVASTSVEVRPRPVVFVHGFSADWRAWTNYLGDEGFLASVGMSGYAVGDGQVKGAMNTGNFLEPTSRTNTIAENAQIVGEYIAKVKELTGAQRVDLVAHSMGGLISRYYIDRVMREGEVAVLVMLGSPMLGTECANLPAALGFYLPATLEIQPVYVQNIFNAQITQRRGVMFHALAGDPIAEAIQSPCTPVPTDLAVSLQSVGGIPLELAHMPVLHTELNASEQVFREYLLPILQTPAGGFAAQADLTPASERLEPMQFTRVFTGHLAQGETQELSIPIEPNVGVASFALFDSSRTLQVEVRGASGNLITLDPVANGLIKVDDPQSMIYLGYGFNNPKPGAWKVKLLTSEATPMAGADYALTAVFQGGAVLEVSTSTLLPKIEEAVDIDAGLFLEGGALPIGQAAVVVRAPDGGVETLAMNTQEDGQVVTADWQPGQAGLYGLEVRTSGTTPDGFAVERSAFLVIEAQAGTELTRRSAILVGAGGVLGVLLVGGAVIGLARRRRSRRRN
jgi:pimeloyl-ACP methyl ester carboxylesterase